MNWIGLSIVVRAGLLDMSTFYQTGPLDPHVHHEISYVLHSSKSRG